eukprot:scaffold3651_cov61-Phaeocystis_antarctica.AAC.12
MLGLSPLRHESTRRSCASIRYSSTNGAIPVPSGWSSRIALSITRPHWRSASGGASARGSAAAPSRSAASSKSPAACATAWRKKRIGLGFKP